MRSRRFHFTTRLLSAHAGTVLLAMACVAAPACSRRITLSLPPGLGEDEARRLTEARRLAADAQHTENADDAADKYRQALRLYREFPQAWCNLGVLMMEQNRYVEASEAFSTAAQIDSDDPRPLYNLGLLYDRRGYLREARGYYEQAIERDPNYLDALRGAIRADSLLNEGSMQTLRWLERALMLEQDRKWLEWMRLQKARIESLPSVKMQLQF